MTAPAVDRSRPALHRALAVCYRLQVRTLVTPGRLIVLGLLSGAAVLTGAVLGTSGRGTGTENAVELISIYGANFLLPIVALVFATSALGDLRDDETLVYLWLRPLPRWVLPTASWLAVLTVAWPLTALPLAAAAWLAGGPSAVVRATIVATTVGAVAYSGAFLALGLRTKRALMWGLLYILIWEGFIANASEGAAEAAVLAYTRSVLADASGEELDLAVVAAPWSWIVPLAVGVVGLAYAARRLRLQDVP